MKRFLLRGLSSGLLAVASTTAALACSCIAPSSPQESREIARRVVADAVAIVEVDVFSGYDYKRNAGERVRVRRILWGKAPETFALERGPLPSSAMCDQLLAPGQRRILILYPAEQTTSGAERYRPHGLCSDYLVQEPRYLAITLEEARRQR